MKRYSSAYSNSSHTSSSAPLALRHGRVKSRRLWTSLLLATVFALAFVASLAFFSPAGTIVTRSKATKPGAGNVALASDSSYFLAQSQPQKHRLRRTLAPTPQARPPATSDNEEKAAIPPASSPTEPETAATPTSPTFVQNVAVWVRDWAVWLVLVLVGLIVAVYFLTGRGSATAVEPAFQDFDTEKESASPGYSTTKIKAKDVNARVDDGSVETTQVETDREYALVVDEEALTRPSPDEIDRHTGQVYAESSEIETLLASKSYEDAYRAYVHRVKKDGAVEFHTEIEQSLSDHFLQRKEYRKARAVLEHHVATHAPEDIDSETYFNLGYIHFFNRTMRKSRRFLKLYVDSSKSSRNSARALRIIAHLDKMQS